MKMANIDYDDITERLVQSNKTTSEEGASIILGQCKSYISSRKSNGKKPTFKNLSVLRNVCEEWIQEFHDEIRESELGVVSADEWNDAVAFGASGAVRILFHVTDVLLLL